MQLLRENTDLTQRVEELTERIEQLTEAIHSRVVA
jgi:cell division septum initiation protein DivIVA